MTARFPFHCDGRRTAQFGRIGHSVPPSATTLFVLMLCGCSQVENAPKYQVADDVTASTITAADFGIDAAAFDRTGVHTLFSEPTKGQFPSGLCVVRAEVIIDPAGRRHLRLVPLPEQHAIYWNHLLDNLRPVREVVFIGHPGLDPRGCTHEDILRVAAANDCELCLIYSRVATTDADAEYVGIIMNTRTGLALATIRAPVVLPMAVAEEMKEKPDCDEAVAEADFRSEQDFRHLVRNLMWDLARQDQATVNREKNPWKNYTPPFPTRYDRFDAPHFDRPAPYNSPGLKKREPSGSNPDEPTPIGSGPMKENETSDPARERSAGDPAVAESGSDQSDH